MMVKTQRGVTALFSVKIVAACTFGLFHPAGLVA